MNFSFVYCLLANKCIAAKLAFICKFEHQVWLEFNNYILN